MTEPYWKSLSSVAPIKAEYVLWDKVKSGGAARHVDDDAAEGRDTKQAIDLSSQRGAPTPTQPQPRAPAPGAATASVGDDENGAAAAAAPAAPEQKKTRLSGAQKKAIARAAAAEQRQAKKEAKKAGAAGAGAKDEGGSANKGRRFDKLAGVGAKVCNATALAHECERPGCKYAHDLRAFVREHSALPGSRLEHEALSFRFPRHVDQLQGAAAAVDECEVVCPQFALTGTCPFGFKCRFVRSHARRLQDGQGWQGCGWELVVDHDRRARFEEERKAFAATGAKSQLSDRGELNSFGLADIRRLRDPNKSHEEKFPMTAQYLTSIGESLFTNAQLNERNRTKGKKRQHDEAEAPSNNTSAPLVAADDDDEQAAAAAAAAPPQDEAMQLDSAPDFARVRPGEKRRLDFHGKLYLAPLTTVGNLPFRRLCGSLGSDIHCSEMGLAQEFLSGNQSEYSLLRRHPSEKLFGVQICGSRPQTLVPAAEMIANSCDIDFLDVNCGCPIDLVFNKGAGSALMTHPTRLARSLVGMSRVLGEIPLTIKIRTGISNTQPIAHKLVPRMQKEWGLSAVTLHGRSRAQRYKLTANWDYIAEVSDTLRAAVADDDLAPIPIFGNGDCYDYRSYYESIERGRTDGIMIARGALVKPWLFTEIKERRDWDISSRERLELIGRLAEFGLEHWGSDTMGVNNTRRFLCEALSFQHRYIPVGLLERLPTALNERPYPYRGRDELETLLSSDNAADWVKITEMFLGPPPDEWNFLPKHKSNAYDNTEVQG